MQEENACVCVCFFAFFYNKEYSVAMKFVHVNNLRLLAISKNWHQGQQIETD